MKATPLARLSWVSILTLFVVTLSVQAARAQSVSCNSIADHLVAQSSHLVIAKIVMPDCARKHLEQGNMLISKPREEWMRLCEADTAAQVALMDNRDQTLRRCRLRGSGVAWD